MKKKIQKKKYIFILAIAIIYLLGISVHVQAAGNRISVKVNESEKAVLEKTKNSWQLTTGDEEKDKQILSSKVLYLRIPKKKELLTGYYTFNSRGEKLSILLIQKSVMYVSKENIILARKTAVYG